MSSGFIQYWQDATYRYTLIGLCAGIALLSLIIGGVSYYYFQQQSALKSAQLYGNSIVELAADQSTDSTLNNDPISLQAVARRIATKPGVNSIIIYDIDNQILAQISEQHTHQHSDITYFTSPIVDSDNIIGSVTLGVVPALLVESSNYTAIIIIGIALLLLAGLSYQRAKAARPMETSTQPVHSDKPETQHTPAATPAAPVASEYRESIYLLLHIKNGAMLSQQLNGESRKQQFQLLEQHIQQASRLYNGEVVAITDACIVLTFCEGKTDSIYNALYSGELILKLNQQKEKSMLIVNGFIQKPGSSISLGEAISVAQKSIHASEHKLFIDESFINEYHLSNHLDTQTAGHAPLVMIEQFKGSYATLLDNQLLQLQAAEDSF